MNSLRAASTARINSSSLSAVAFDERLALFWMTKTIQNVTTVVVVLMKSCHVSEKLNNGPVRAQTTTIRTDPASAGKDPSAVVIRSDMRLNRSASEMLSFIP